MMRWHDVRPAVAAGLAGVIALAGCGGGGDGDNKASPPSGQPGEIRIANFEFQPQTAVVKPGTKVTWTNADSSVHDIKDTSPLATPVSPSMNKGDTFSITYTQPGTYSYVCGIHPYMIGSVEVVP
ncbi:MAG TPA: plastocyanin/azurin family copper-binding protein [Acidimicrobiia bacterium]|nr:plastocyanin/azurin family copper-binding protein [Acidimicrobiia bacterium]